MLAIHAFFLWSVRGRIEKGDPDFTVFYTAGQMLREGRAAQLYYLGAQQAVQQEFTRNSDLRRGPLPYIHPPFEALIFLPLTFLPYEYAFALWNVANLGMLLAIATLLRRSLPRLGEVPTWEWLLAFLAFFPIFSNFLQGQDAVLLLLLFVLGFSALDSGEDILAGCWFGLGVFKYHFVIPLVLVLVLWRGRKLLSGFAVTASAMTLLSLGIVGWQGAFQYPVYAWKVVSTPGHGQTPLGLTPNLLGLVTGWPFLDGMTTTLRWVVLLASVSLLAIIARMWGMARDRRYFKLCFACAVVTAVLVGYNTNAHDLSLLILPLALVADYCVSAMPRSNDKIRIIAPAVPLLISPLWFLLWIRWEQTNLMALFLVLWLFANRREVSRRSASADGGGPRFQ
jgi:hypothetical protein